MKIQNELLLAMWSIAYQNQSVFDEALKGRIKALRRQGSHTAVIIDSWGLALIKLARQRGLTCNLNVMELPWKLLDDEPADKTGLSLPLEAELQAIIQEKGL